MRRYLAACPVVHCPSRPLTSQTRFLDPLKNRLNTALLYSKYIFDY
jgi:hypothetical protein